MTNLAEKPERLDIRLSEEEKKRLEELAKQKGVSMTNLVRTWIQKGDVVHVLAEQLQDFVKDFDKWHVSENRSTNIRHLCENLHGRMGAIENESLRTVLYDWTNFLSQSFQLLKGDISTTKRQLGEAIKTSVQAPRTERLILHVSILEFSKIVVSYHNIFIKGFLDIVKNMDERTQRRIGETYNDEVRTRYNEIASKYEDYLKRAQRELGESLEQAIPRAKEFRSHE